MTPRREREREHVRHHFREFGFRKHCHVTYPHGTQFEHDVWHPAHPDNLEDWQDWFRAHGIDPDEVLLTHWVERHTVGTNAITYLEEGVRDGEPITVHRHVELTEKPLCFPDTEEGAAQLADWRAGRAMERPRPRG